jgi:hypothetical protein
MGVTGTAAPRGNLFVADIRPLCVFVSAGRSEDAYYMSGLPVLTPTPHNTLGTGEKSLRQAKRVAKDS